ncbi:chemotaxis protein CheW [Desulfuromonas carbonis]|uniref:chemotaxis protein CheW n=1 Tax=Desulfuromonas sp. DDH964 TaxID=1823759 RepID=UPI00078D2F68|nr:chemotaxis protein CheW [Desulfuromonas sp. DDH964]AMV71743.1 scaffold protein CheW associated with MCPs of class 34H [Desulfuromonas sp. DDH964]
MSGAATTSLQYLTFSLGDEVFAVDVTKAREVLDFTTVTRVPQTPRFMIGVINLRSSVVPVIDLRLKFGMAATERTVNTCIIVMDIVVDGDLLTVGALVDSVREVLEIGSDHIEPPPRIGTRLKTEFLKGMAGIDDHFVMLLDIDRVFSADELALVQAASEEAETVE